MSKSKKTDAPMLTAGKVAALALLAIAPPSIDGVREADKALEKLGHKLVPPFTVSPDGDGEVMVPETISNIAHIMAKAGDVDGVLLCPNWVDDPYSRVEVFAAVVMDLKLYALSVDGALVEIDQWAVLMTLASHPQFKEAQAIYAPLPGSSRAG